MSTEFPAWRRHVSLALLGLVATINYIDRQAITVLQEDIKAEFALSDTMLGLISGLYFALIYGIAALPLARLADRGDRATLVGSCLAFGVWRPLRAGSSPVPGNSPLRGWRWRWGKLVPVQLRSL